MEGLIVIEVLIKILEGLANQDEIKVVLWAS